MLNNAFIGKKEPPSSEELSAALGPSTKLWEELVSGMEADHITDGREWNSYSPKVGWALRLKHKKRNILYLGPREGTFHACLVLGGKAVKAAHEGKLPARAIKLIDTGKQYPEGTSVRLDVKTHADVEIVKKLALVKAKN